MHRGCSSSPAERSLVDAGERMHVTLYAAGVDDGEPVLTPLECALGPNWIVTSHHGKVDVLEEFRERAEGGGEVGALDCALVCRSDPRVGRRRLLPRLRSR